MEHIQAAGKPATWPEKFLKAIQNMPDCSGIAVGVDRLVMLFSDTSSIDDVVAFPSDRL